MTEYPTNATAVEWKTACVCGMGVIVYFDWYQGSVPTARKSISLHPSSPKFINLCPDKGIETVTGIAFMKKK